MSPIPNLRRAVIAGLCLGTAILAQDPLARVTVALVKPGDPNAADAERAAPFLRRLEAALAEHVPAFAGATVSARLCDDAAEAAELLAERPTRLAIVPPGFYLAHAEDADLRLRVVASVPRLGAVTERYRLVTRRGANAPADLQALHDETVAIQGWPDPRYLRRVVFATDAEELPFELVPTRNLADTVFDLVEPEPDADGPAAILVDDAQFRFLERDELVWPELKVVWSSAELPRDLVVACGRDWDDSAVAKLRTALLAFDDHDQGREVLKLMGSPGFAQPDTDRLVAATRHAPAVTSQ